MSLHNIPAISSDEDQSLAIDPLEDSGVDLSEQSTVAAGKASAASMLESDSDDYLAQMPSKAASQPMPLIDSATANIVSEVTLSAPDQLALLQQTLQSVLANPNNRLPLLEEALARQILLLANGSFTNGAVAGMNRADFEQALRSQIRGLLDAALNVEPYVENVEEARPIDTGMRKNPDRNVERSSKR